MAERSSVIFRTNDPLKPTARINVVIAKVTGGVFTTPQTVVFGDVPFGTESRQVVEVRDAAVSPRSVKSVLSSNAQRFSVRLLDLTSKMVEPGSSRLIAKIEVLTKASEVGSLNGEVIVQLDDPSRRTHELPVAGRVVTLVEAFPSALALPRASGDGPIYWAQCICRNIEGKPVMLKPKELPVGISVNVMESECDPCQQLIRIVWDPEIATKITANQVTALRFAARVGEQDTQLEIPLRLERAARNP